MPSTENALRLPQREPGAYNRRGRRIADELEAQVEEKTMFGQLPRSVNTNLAAYDESVTLPGVFADLRGATGDIKPEPPKADPKPPAPTPDRTVTSPNTGNMPTNWAEYEDFLNQKSIYLANNRNRTTGFESNDLPAGSQPITAETLLKGTGAYTDMLYGGKLRQGEMTTPELKGLGTGMAENYRPGTYGVDPQAGASSLPDSSDQSRALEVDQTKNRALPRGARQQEMFLRQNPGYGQESPEIEKGSGISARGRAFLDAPMGVGPRELMQRTNAAQNILRKDGKIAIKDGEGNFNEISQEGYDKIRGDMRDQTEFSQDFLKQYITTPAKPADSQSNDSLNPKPVTKESSKEPNPYGMSGIYSTMIQNFGAENVPGFTQKDREPLMRFPGIK